jgi:hypothetical protein
LNDINKITTGITSKSNNNITHQQITRVKSSIEYHIYHDGIIKYKLIDETGNGTDKTEYSLKTHAVKQNIFTMILQIIHMKLAHMIL